MRQASYGSQIGSGDASIPPRPTFGLVSEQFGAANNNQMSPNQQVAFSPEHNPRFMGTGDFADPRNGMLSSVTKSGRGFREKILAQLGNAQLDDSKFASNSEQEYDGTASLGYNPLQSANLAANKRQ